MSRATLRLSPDCIELSDGAPRLAMAVVHALRAARCWRASRWPRMRGKVYRWTDQNGVTHYGDRPPGEAREAPAQVKVIPVRAEPGAMARLRLENDDGRYLALADNTLAGPIEVMLQFTRSDERRRRPALPARATVPARGSVLVARLHAPIQRAAASSN